MVNCIVVFCSLRRGFNNIWERQRASKLVGLEHLFLLRGGSEMNWTGWPKNTSAVAMIQSNPWFRTCDFGIRPRKHQGSANSHGRISLDCNRWPWPDMTSEKQWWFTCDYMWHVVYIWIYALITAVPPMPFQWGDEHLSQAAVLGCWGLAHTHCIQNPLGDGLRVRCPILSYGRGCHILHAQTHTHVYIYIISLCVCAFNLFADMCVLPKLIIMIKMIMGRLGHWVTLLLFCDLTHIFLGAAKDHLPSLFFFSPAGPSRPPGPSNRRHAMSSDSNAPTQEFIETWPRNPFSFVHIRSPPWLSHILSQEVSGGEGSYHFPISRKPELVRFGMHLVIFGTRLKTWLEERQWRCIFDCLFLGHLGSILTCTALDLHSWFGSFKCGLDWDGLTCGMFCREWASLDGFGTVNVHAFWEDTCMEALLPTRAKDWLAKLSLSHYQDAAPCHNWRAL